MQTFRLSFVVACTLVLLAPVSNTLQAKGGNSNDWKGWHEWEWEQPTYEDLTVRFEYSPLPLALVVDFVSVWDERFDKYSTAADGFLVFHITSAVDIEDLLLKAVSPENMKIVGGGSKEICFLAGGEIRSLFVPIKAPGTTGEFKIETSVTMVDSGIHIDETIFVVKKHRRDIRAFNLGEYFAYKREERLASVQKRPGAELYSPRDYFEAGIPIDMPADPAPNPAMEGYSDYLSNVQIPPGESYEIEKHPEWFLDVEYPDVHSHYYTFHGRFVFTEPYSNDAKNVAFATVVVFDDDSDEGKMDEVICGHPLFTTQPPMKTNANGSFKCVGKATDADGSYPDPYVVIYPVNEAVKVKDCIANVWRGTKYDWVQSIHGVGAWVDEDGNEHDYTNLEPGTYNMVYDPIWVGTDELSQRQYMTFDQLNFGLWRNIDAWRAAVDPSIQYPWLGEYKACVPAESNSFTGCKYSCGIGSCSDTLQYWGMHAVLPTAILHEFGHAFHGRLIGGTCADLPGARPNMPSHAYCDFNHRSNDAFREGFAQMMPMYVYNAPYKCHSHMPSQGVDPCPSNFSGDSYCCGDGLEGSFVHPKYDDYPSVQWYYDSYIVDPDSVGGWHKGLCDSEYKSILFDGVKQALGMDVFGWFGAYVLDEPYEIPINGTLLVNPAKSGIDEYQVNSALWDLYDGHSGKDEKCEFHFVAAQRDSCDTWYAYQDEESWGLILAAVAQNPKNYFEFIEEYYGVVRDKAIAEGISFDECNIQNYLRATSRFNGITLDGIFGLELYNWGRKDFPPYLECDKYAVTPGQDPPCAATEAVVEAVEDEVENVSMTPEEGEALLDKIRIIRDEYLLKSDRGNYYAFLYSTCSEEIVDGILGSPDITLTALELMQDAAQKIENIEQYIESGESPIDENFVFMVTTILDELKSHTSDELLNSIDVVEGDIDIVRGMTVQEILEYFEWEEQ